MLVNPAWVEHVCRDQQDHFVIITGPVLRRRIDFLHRRYQTRCRRHVSMPAADHGCPSSAVVQMLSRNFPGLHLQGDTFAALRTQLAGGAGPRIRHDPSDADALDELDGVVGEMDTMLSFYERVLFERGLKRPY